MTAKTLAAAAALLLAACASIPSGPTHPALPGRAKSFEQFQRDDAACREYALAQIGGRSSVERGQESAVASAVVGTAIGAAAGAALGGDSGAGVGAGLGLIAGAALGSSGAKASYAATQRRFDGAYHQCMYAKGHKVPVYGHYAQTQRQRSYPPPPDAPPPVAPPPNIPPERLPPPDAPPPR
ncbi:MAG: hypothetical protein NZL99_08555 [Burkholderiaceae bacterium]|nr:hypothetical protein [Burkholderiaceae bacterium]